MQSTRPLRGHSEMTTSNGTGDSAESEAISAETQSATCQKKRHKGRSALYPSAKPAIRLAAQLPLALYQLRGNSGKTRRLCSRCSGDRGRTGAGWRAFYIGG